MASLIVHMTKPTTKCVSSLCKYTRPCSCAMEVSLNIVLQDRHVAHRDHLPVIVSGVGELCPGSRAPFQRQLDPSVASNTQQQPFCVPFAA